MTFTPQPPTLQTTAHGRCAAAWLLPWMACVVSGAVAAADDSPRAASRVIVDPQVTTAGGHACRSCGSGQCGLHGHCGRRHHPDCREGECVPFCPVRPSTFGFYGTQWRRWPGQGVVPASAEDAATPMPPPKSAVPGPDEESPMRPDEPGADADVNADRTPADGDEPKSDEPKSDEAEAGDAAAPAQPAPTTQPPAKPETAKPETAKPETAPDDSPAEPMPERKPAPTTPAPQRLPTLEDILGSEGAEPAPPGRDPLPRDADAPAEPSPDEPADAPAQGEPVPDPTPGDDTGNPFEDDAAVVPDQGVELVGFRYPAAVGASLEPGGWPWRLAPPTRQRPAGSPRGR